VAYKHYKVVTTLGPPKIVKCKKNLAVPMTILRSIISIFIKHDRINMPLLIVMMSPSAPPMVKLTVMTRLSSPRLMRPVPVRMNPPIVRMLLMAILYSPIFVRQPLMLKVMMTKISRPPIIMGPLVVVWTDPPMVKPIITIILRHPMITVPLMVVRMGEM